MAKILKRGRKDGCFGIHCRTLPAYLVHHQLWIETHSLLSDPPSSYAASDAAVVVAVVVDVDVVVVDVVDASQQISR